MRKKKLKGGLSIIKINEKSGLAYISEKIRQEGYHDDVEYLSNTITLILIRPGSSLEDVKKSLRTVLRGIDLRLKYHESENPTRIPSDSSTKG